MCFMHKAHEAIQFLLALKHVLRRVKIELPVLRKHLFSFFFLRDLLKSLFKNLKKVFFGICMYNNVLVSNLQLHFYCFRHTSMVKKTFYKIKVSCWKQNILLGFSKVIFLSNECLFTLREKTLILWSNWMFFKK